MATDVEGCIREIDELFAEEEKMENEFQVNTSTLCILVSNIALLGHPVL